VNRGNLELVFRWSSNFVMVSDGFAFGFGMFSVSVLCLSISMVAPFDLNRGLNGFESGV